MAVSSEDHIKINTSATRAKNSQSLKVFAPQTEIYRSSYFPRSVTEWNTLSDNIVLSEIVDIFKLIDIFTSKLSRHFDYKPMHAHGV